MACGGIALGASARSPKEEMWLSGTRIKAKGRSWGLQIKFLYYQKTSSPSQAESGSFRKVVDNWVEIGQIFMFSLQTPVLKFRSHPSASHGLGCLSSWGA